MKFLFDVSLTIVVTSRASTKPEAKHELPTVNRESMATQLLNEVGGETITVNRIIGFRFYIGLVAKGVIVSLNKLIDSRI